MDKELTIAELRELIKYLRHSSKSDRNAGASKV